MLWEVIGPALFAGLAVILFNVPLTYFNTMLMGKASNRLMHSRDRRVATVNETLSAIKLVKSNAWQSSFKERITKSREEELGPLFKFQVVMMMFGIQWELIPLMMAVAAFAAFVMLGNELTAEVAFTSLALFDILKMPMLDLGWIVGSMVKAYVALSRVSAYLTTPELETEGISVGRAPPAAGSSEPAIKVTKASFVWGQGQPPNMERKEVKRICSDLDKALQVGAISDSRHTALVRDAHPLAPSQPLAAVEC